MIQTTHVRTRTLRGWRNKLLGASAALLAVPLLTTLAPSPAGASVGPADDRVQSAPTSWWAYNGQSAASLTAQLNYNHARLTDLRVESVNSSGVPTFNAVMVANTGTYASGYWWYYGQTIAQVSSLLNTNHARLITAQGYNTPAGQRFAVVMVPNTGSNAKTWYWYVGSPSFISSKVTQTRSRLINFSATNVAGQYVGIMIANAGTDALSWWWYYNVSPTQVSSYLSANHARIVDLDRNANGTFNVVMYNSPARWYWYYGVTPASAVHRALQQGERIIDATSYVVGGVRYWAYASTENLSLQGLKMWNALAPKVDSGAFGFYVKQVGGGVATGVNSTTQYEPASALKVLYHAKSIHEESLGHTSDATTITYNYNPADPTNPGICPDSYAAHTVTNLKTADTKMMQNSDNRMTKGILNLYGKASVLSYASSLGLTSTQINHNIGCPTATTHNKTTLSDLGKVYEAMQNNTVTSNAYWKQQFGARMLNQANYGGFKSTICPVVNQEAASLGKSSAVATAFCNAMTFIAKGGSYQYGGALPYQVSFDDVWLSSVPFKSSGVVAPRYYISGWYVDGTTINSTTEQNNISAGSKVLDQEALRPFIRSALTTW